MKKIYLFLLAVIISVPSFNIAAQDDKMSYKDQKLLGAGISIGYYSYGFMGTRSVGIPPLSAYYEMGVHDYITAGPFLGIARWSYRYTTADYRYSWTFINAGVRGSFHITGFVNEILGLDINEEKIDWYISLLLGLELRNYSEDSSWTGSTYGNTTNFFIGPSTGVRYYLSDNLAVFAEGGRGALGVLTFGVSLKM